MNEIESGFKIHGDNGIPLLLTHPQHQAILGDTSIVDKDINGAKLLLDLLDHLFCLCKVGRV